MSVSPPERRLHGRGFCLCCSLTNPDSLEQCLAPRKCSINIGLINDFSLEPTPVGFCAHSSSEMALVKVFDDLFIAKMVDTQSSCDWMCQWHLTPLSCPIFLQTFPLCPPEAQICLDSLSPHCSLLLSLFCSIDPGKVKPCLGIRTQGQSPVLQSHVLCSFNPQRPSEKGSSI